MKGKLFLIPTVLSEGTEAAVLPDSLRTTIRELSWFLCENIRTSRRFVAGLKVHPTVESLQFLELNKDTTPEMLADLLQPLMQGTDMGLLSEAGCPAVADPGSLAVAFAHDNGIRVVPLTGPSALLLALMASGLNGQRFAFQGYLPVDAREAERMIRKLEHESAEKQQTQLFIETPFRNDKLLGYLLRTLRPDTRLCLAVNVTAPEESIRCLTVAAWRREAPVLGKVPVTFLFLAARDGAK